MNRERTELDSDEDGSDFCRETHRERRAKALHELRAFGVLD
jgi:hypothetical protein